MIPPKPSAMVNTFVTAGRALEPKQATNEDQALAEIANGFRVAGDSYTELSAGFRRMLSLPGTPTSVCLRFATDLAQLGQSLRGISALFRRQSNDTAVFATAAAALRALASDMRDVSYPAGAAALETAAARMEALATAFGSPGTPYDFVQFFRAVFDLSAALDDVGRAVALQQKASMEGGRASGRFECPPCHYINSTVYITRRGTPASCEAWHHVVKPNTPFVDFPEAGIYTRVCQYTVTEQRKTCRGCYDGYWSAWWAWGASSTGCSVTTSTTTESRSEWTVAAVRPSDSLPTQGFEELGIDGSITHVEEHDQGSSGVGAPE